MVFANYQSTIIHKTFTIMALFYVSATDKLLSGWGEASGKTSKFVVACDTEDQVKQTKKWMESQTLRGEHVFGNIVSSREKPYCKSSWQTSFRFTSVGSTINSKLYEL